MKEIKFKTLFDVYKYVETSHIFIESTMNEREISADEFKNAVETNLYNLQKIGMKKGNELIFQIKDNAKFTTMFWACILGGFIPVPYTYLGNAREQVKLIGVWKRLNNPFLATDEEYMNQFENSAELKPETMLRTIKKKTLIIEKMQKYEGEVVFHKPEEDDIAFIQFSSGSTSEPKGVVITHKNIISSVQATLRAMDVSKKDIYLSWLPLTHSFGLIGTYLTPLMAGCDFYIMPPELFVTYPWLWIEKMSEHQITITASPNFGLKHVCKYVKSHRCGMDINLSSLRTIIDGAEPVSSKVCEEFINAMSRFKMKSTAVKPSYGLSEATLVVSTPERDAKYKEIFVKRNHVKVGKKIIEVPGVQDGTMSFVSVGVCLDNIESKIVDDFGNTVEDCVIGHLLLRGESIFKRYYNDEQATKAAINSKGWLDTGDLGFFYGRNLFVTGREKDVIFIKGENYYSHDIENLCNEVSEGQFTKVAVCAECGDEQERVICFVEYIGEPQLFDDITKRIKRHILHKVGLGIGAVIPVNKIPETGSGKLKRYLLLEQYRAVIPG